MNLKARSAMLLFAAGLLCACGGGGDGNDAGDADLGDGNVIDTGVGDGGGGGDGSGGDGGGDGSVALAAHRGLTLAAAGTVCKSTNYKLYVTLGQSPGGNVTSSSTNFKLHGGVVGATQ